MTPRRIAWLVHAAMLAVAAAVGWLAGWAWGLVAWAAQVGVLGAFVTWMRKGLQERHPAGWKTPEDLGGVGIARRGGRP